MIVELMKDISKPGRLELKIDEPKDALAGASCHIKMSSKGHRVGVKQAHAFHEAKKGSLLWIHGKCAPVSLKCCIR
jgi:hypothetical protein